jgi:hypothetical protein
MNHELWSLATPGNLGLFGISLIAIILAWRLIRGAKICRDKMKKTTARCTELASKRSCTLQSSEAQKEHTPVGHVQA